MTARTYPAGVTCWIDTEQPDPAAASRFYGGLFGWTFTNVMPPQAPSVYLIAQLAGQDVGAIGSGPSEAPESATWNTYIAVAEADAAALALAAAGATVTDEPHDAGPGGRTASVLDPQGAEFRLWQAYRRLGAQSVNVPGSWNFSDLRTADIAGARAFYGDAFGWEYLNLGDSVETMVSVPGYGDHLAATSDPEIYQRQAGSPAGFADVIGAIEGVAPDVGSSWHVKFSVADRDASVARAVSLGATLLETSESPWAAFAEVRDPQGAEFTLSEFRPPA
ncbi:VOC family protein [Cryobacterium melibiosiphilum]|uniref:VOC family protein n=1 Tax=Cryobacterium melibiosiphilum TaxID=995039 RepID=A0A3A5MCG8_9MICO|nr:VOC family protein [Cryobacterium melibiosiphilum]RJT87182.1 VOC family protein [Cryobacterium melibiosiphilum]